MQITYRRFGPSSRGRRSIHCATRTIYGDVDGAVYNQNSFVYDQAAVSEVTFG
jgi:hypothetical protein